MSVSKQQTTLACDWVIEKATETMASPTYCPKTVTTEQRPGGPFRVVEPDTERDRIQWLTVPNGDRPARHFCPEHAPLVQQMGLST